MEERISTETMQGAAHAMLEYARTYYLCESGLEKSSSFEDESVMVRKANQKIYTISYTIPDQDSPLEITLNFLLNHTRFVLRSATLRSGYHSIAVSALRNVTQEKFLFSTDSEGILSELEHLTKR